MSRLNAAGDSAPLHRPGAAAAGVGAGPLAAVRAVARGEQWWTAEQIARLWCWREEVREPWESLTEREREVLRLLAEGLDNAAIGEALCVTVRTVECHVTSILSKLDVASRLAAVVWVHQHWPEDLWKATG